MREKHMTDPGDLIKKSTVVGRRHALQLLGSIGITGGLAASTACQSTRATSRYVPAQPVQRTLSEADFALLCRLTALIIPKTDTAGALEAGVPDFIDSSLPTMSSAQLATMSGSAHVFLDKPSLLFADGLRWMEEQAVAAHGNGFLELQEAQQSALLEAVYAEMESTESPGRSAQFLRALKNLTVEAYYTSQEGLIDELGYKGNTPQQMSQLECKS